MDISEIFGKQLHKDAEKIESLENKLTEANKTISELKGLAKEQNELLNSINTDGDAHHDNCSGGDGRWCLCGLTQREILDERFNELLTPPTETSKDKTPLEKAYDFLLPKDDSERGEIKNGFIEVDMISEKVDWTIKQALEVNIESIAHVLDKHYCDCTGHEERFYGLCALKQMLNDLKPFQDTPPTDTSKDDSEVFDDI